MPRRDQYLAHLAEVPMFSACTKKELGEIGRHTDEVAFEPGTTLVREGDPGQEFFILLSGSARVTRKGKELAVLGAGEWFGELALLDKAPRNATVTATTPVKVLVLSQRSFKGLLSEVPTISVRLLTGMARRLHDLDAKV
ncbi:MAG: family transcriptional regulator, cyclic receptor protein [Acidimicrobiaceae bacterium]|nr:family transcriptional regulator, cyclic receptor protein [Acidimicrobiaceae bacterium]MDQ1444106.1 family transcriptional regulator, cyclic receptor protein [Acidimicrobiaceae bacterium]